MYTESTEAGLFWFRFLLVALWQSAIWNDNHCHQYQTQRSPHSVDVWKYQWSGTRCHVPAKWNTVRPITLATISVLSCTGHTMAIATNYTCTVYINHSTILPFLAPFQFSLDVDMYVGRDLSQNRIHTYYTVSTDNVTDWPSWWQLPHLRFLTVCGPPDHRSFSPWWKLLPFPLPFFLFGSDQLEFESPTDKPGSAFVSLGFTSAHMKKSHRLSWGFTQQKKSRPWLGPCLRVVLL